MIAVISRSLHTKFHFPYTSKEHIHFRYLGKKNPVLVEYM